MYRYRQQTEKPNMNQRYSFNRLKLNISHNAGENWYQEAFQVSLYQCSPVLWNSSTIGKTKKKEVIV